MTCDLVMDSNGEFDFQNLKLFVNNIQEDSGKLTINKEHVSWVGIKYNFSFDYYHISTVGSCSNPNATSNFNLPHTLIVAEIPTVTFVSENERISDNDDEFEDDEHQISATKFLQIVPNDQDLVTLIEEHLKIGLANHPDIEDDCVDIEEQDESFDAEECFVDDVRNGDNEMA